MVLRSVGVMSVGKLLGAMYAIMGLIFGGFFSLLSLMAGGINPNQGDPNPLPFMIGGMAAVIILPIVYGIMGFVGGIISAVVYNFIAGMVGGIEMDFERRVSPNLVAATE